MTSEEFLMFLKRSGIPEGSRDMRDYEEAKRLVMRYAENSIEYENMLDMAAKYVGV